MRFQDGLILQGTFRAQEKLQAVHDFIRENIQLDWIPFTLSVQGGVKLGDSQAESTLAELNLAPAALVHFVFNPDVLKDVAAQKGSVNVTTYLKQELLTMVTDLT